MHHELKNLEKFAYHLRVDDREVFEDMMLQCELYCPHSGDMASVVKEIPLLTAIIFGQHKMILDLQRRCSIHESNPVTSKMTESVPDKEASREVAPGNEEAKPLTNLRNNLADREHDPIPTLRPRDPSE